MTHRLKWIVFALTLLACAVRVYRLDAQSLWSDEGLSLYRSRLALAENLTNVIVVPPGVPTQDTNPPLYFVSLSGLRSVAGESEYALRFLSVMAGVILVPLLYATGRRLFTAQAGMMAAALGALSPFLVWYSQEARMYTLVAALSLASVYVLLRALAPWLPLSGLEKASGRDGSRWWLAWVVVTVAAVYTHFTAFFLLPFEAIVIVTVLVRSIGQAALLAGVSVLILATPIVLYAWSRAGNGIDPNFGFRPLDSIAEELVGALSIGRTNQTFQPLWAVAPALAMFVIGAAGSWLDRPRKIGPSLLASLYIFGPVLLFYAATFVLPLYTGPRHLMLVAPAFYMLVGNGLAVAWRRVPIIGLAALIWIAASMLFWLRVQFFDPAYVKDDMRSAARTVSERSTADDVVIVHDAISSFVFDYYYHGPAPRYIIPAYPSRDVDAALAEFEQRAQAADRVWFVTDPPPLHGFPATALDEWARGHLLRLDHKRFPSIWLGSAYQLYTAQFPILDSLPASAAPQTLAWPGGLQLAGVDPITFPSPVEGAGEGERTARLALYWTLDMPSQINYVVTVRWVDESGVEWLRSSGTAFDNWSAKRWPVGKVIRQDVTLNLPASLPSAKYHLWLSLAERISGAPLAMADGTGEADIASFAYPSGP
jgi:4-amino-4-deoxy-L-arabinose transferase-like glycosyltransferase